MTTYNIKNYNGGNDVLITYDLTVSGADYKALDAGLLLCYGLTPAQHAKAFNFAWDMSHAYGLDDVVATYSDLVDIVNA